MNSKKGSKSISKTNPVFFDRINSEIDKCNPNRIDEMGKLSLLQMVEEEYFAFLKKGNCSKKAQTRALEKLQQHVYEKSLI